MMATLIDGDYVSTRSELGSPISSTIEISMGAVEFENEPFLFFKGSDGGLWLYTELPYFRWTDLGLPPKKGVKLGSSMGAIAYEGTSTPDEGSIFVYVKADGGDLWLNTISEFPL
jgi:hypothetical protein